VKFWSVYTVATAVTFGAIWGSTRVINWYTDTERYQSDRCLKGRQAFFEACYKVEQPVRCEEMWANKRGHVFNGDPADGWVEEIDCSSEVK
jgi:hypothetical protein